jgi:hypothetical protein
MELMKTSHAPAWWVCRWGFYLTPHLVYHLEKCQGFGRQTYVYILNDIKIRPLGLVYWYTFFQTGFIPAVKKY